jgi:hypothetical protein
MEEGESKNGKHALATSEWLDAGHTGGQQQWLLGFS